VKILDNVYKLILLMKDQITANLVLVIIKQLNSVNHHSVMYAVMHLFHPNLPIFLNVKFNVKKIQL